MDPDIRTPDIYTIETAPVTTPDSHVVCLAVCDRSHDQVEHGSVDKDDVVDREVGGLLNTNETSTVPLAALVLFVSIACSTVSKA